MTTKSRPLTSTKRAVVVDDYADVLYFERERRELTQAEAAKAFGVSRWTYHRWERGEVTPSEDSAKTIVTKWFRGRKDTFLKAG